MKSSKLSRRSLLKQVGVFGAGVMLPAVTRGIESERLDRFGGLKSVRFDASGYFRIEKSDRWWFVTPEGSAFLSFGLNHPNEDYITQDYNVEFWKEKFGVEDVSDPVFRAGFVKKVMSDLARFGMNSLGTHSLKPRFGKLTVPYVQALFFVKTPYWMKPTKDKFVDVFAPAFEQQCNRIVQRVIAPRKNDPYLLGYTFTDCPILTDGDAKAQGQVPWGRAHADLPTWPRVLRNLGQDSSGKQVYVELMRDRYSNIEAFNSVYASNVSSFNDLLGSENWSDVFWSAEIDDTADNRAFLLKIMDQYYTVACAAIRRVDPNHLIFGDILNGQTGTPDEIVSLVSKYTDLVAYQTYSQYDEHRSILDRWSRLSGKPLYHADTSFCVPYEQMPAPIGAVSADQESRAQSFYECASRSFSRTDVIGWNWCGWMDMWAKWKSDRQHTGLQDPFGRYHHPMPDTMKRFGEELYDYGLRNQFGK
jgi:hypothetical protein